MKKVYAVILLFAFTPTFFANAQYENCNDNEMQQCDSNFNNLAETASQQFFGWLSSACNPWDSPTAIMSDIEDFLDGSISPFDTIDQISEYLDALECVDMAYDNFMQDLDNAANNLMDCTYNAGCCYNLPASNCSSGWACHNPNDGPICD